MIAKLEKTTGTAVSAPVNKHDVMQNRSHMGNPIITGCSTLFLVRLLIDCNETSNVH